MTKNLRITLMLVGVLVSIGTADAQQAPDPRAADLVQAGKVRVALFLPQYNKNPATGELQPTSTGGVHVEIARAFAARLGIETFLVGYPSPPRVEECLKADACDVAFMAINPARTKEVGFAPAHLEVDYTYLVPAGSPIRNVADTDRVGIGAAGDRARGPAWSPGSAAPTSQMTLQTSGQQHCRRLSKRNPLAISLLAPTVSITGGCLPLALAFGRGWRPQRSREWRLCCLASFATTSLLE